MVNLKLSKFTAFLSIRTNLDLGLSMNNKTRRRMVTLVYLLAVSSSSSMAGRLSFFPEVLLIFTLAN